MGKKDTGAPISSEAVEAYASGLTPRTIILGLGSMIFIQYASTVMQLFGNKPATFAALAVPPIWWVIVNELIGRAKKEWRFTPAELTLLILPMYIIAGDKFILFGAPASAGENLVGTIWMNFMFVTYGLKLEPHSAVWSGLAPPWFAPRGEPLDMLYSGLKPGQTLIWSVFVMPSIYWAVTLILWSVLNTLIVFVITGPQWWEKERLPFLYSLGHSYIFAKSGDIDEATNKSRLFSWKNEKVFWVGGIFGLILSLIPVIYEVFPAFPPLGARQWGIWSFYLPSGILPPGTQSGGWVLTNMLYMGVLLPNELLWTALFSYVFFGLIYQYVGLQTGFLPWSPGRELDVGSFWGWRPPWPYAYMADGGMTIGVALWCLWLARDRIKMLAGTIMKGKDVTEYGMSLRKGVIGFIVVSIAFIAWFAGFGMPAIVAIAFWVIWVVWSIGQGRVYNETQTAGGMDPVLWHVGWTWLHPIGVLFGAWTTQTPTASSAWLITEANMTATAQWGPRHSSQTTGLIGFYYAMAHRTKSLIKHTLIWTVLVIVILALIQPFLWIYVIAHGGGIVQKGSAGITSTIGGRGVLDWGQITPGMDFGLYGLWTAIGIFFSIGIYLIRMRFPWFFLNPAMLIATMFTLTWMWLPSTISLVIKLIGVRVLGARKFDELARPFCCGAIVFFGSLYLVSMLYNLSTVTIPAMQTKWVS